MAKYHGKVGFIKTVEDPVGSGVWTETVTERYYYGDVNRFVGRWASASKVNDDVDISNEISIVADSFANSNLQAMRYVEWCGALWKINSIDVQYPRLILSIGGVYNGSTPESSSEI